MNSAVRRPPAPAEDTGASNRYETTLGELLGPGPFAFSMEQARRILAVHSAGGLATMQALAPIDLAPTVHAHESCEILVPITPMPETLIGRGTYTLSPKLAMTANSQQEHGSMVPIPDSRFLVMHIDTSLIEQVAGDMFGRRGVSFANRAFVFDSQLRSFLGLFQEEAGSDAPGHQFVASSAALILVAGILRRAPGNLPLLPTRREGYRHPRVVRAIEYMRANQDREIPLAELAQLTGLSPYHFIRAFRAESGRTPHEYLINLRIERARQLLRTTESSITEICYTCGFANPSHFATTFKRLVGISPSEYRR